MTEISLPVVTQTGALVDESSGRINVLTMGIDQFSPDAQKEIMQIKNDMKPLNQQYISNEFVKLGRNIMTEINDAAQDALYGKLIKDIGDVDILFGDAISTLKSVEPNTKLNRLLSNLPIVSRIYDTLKWYAQQYTKVITEFEKMRSEFNSILLKLTDTIPQINKNIELNKIAQRRLIFHITAIKMWKKEIEETHIPAITTRVNNGQMDPMILRNAQTVVNMLIDKLRNFDDSLFSIQQKIDRRNTTVGNCWALQQKITFIVDNAIPAWKDGIQEALCLKMLEHSADKCDKFIEKYNESQITIAEMFESSSKNVAQQAVRPITKIETAAEVHRIMQRSIQEVKDLVENELRQAENDMEARQKMRDEALY